jgi:hypothetical protein
MIQSQRKYIEDYSSSRSSQVKAQDCRRQSTAKYANRRTCVPNMTCLNGWWENRRRAILPAENALKTRRQTPVHILQLRLSPGSCSCSSSSEGASHRYQQMSSEWPVGFLVSLYPHLRNGASVTETIPTILRSAALISGNKQERCRQWRNVFYEDV